MREAIYLWLLDLQDQLDALAEPHRQRLRSLWRCRGQHCNELVITATRMHLHCVRCDRNTPGWDVRLNQGAMTDAD